MAVPVVETEKSHKQVGRIYLSFESLLDNANMSIKTYKTSLFHKLLCKSHGHNGHGDSWYNEIANVYKVAKKLGEDSLQEMMLENVVVTTKFDGSQIGVTIQNNEERTVTGLSRNRELTESEMCGSTKFGMVGSMSNAFPLFVTFTNSLLNELNHILHFPFKSVTVTGEVYRATLHKKSAPFTSILPFQMILELDDTSEIVMLMTPGLHKFFMQFASVQTQFETIFDASEFMINANTSHVFPVPIFFIGSRADAIRYSHSFIISHQEHFVEGVMITGINNPCFVLKLKTPQHTKGEITNIHRLIAVDNTPEENDMYIDNPELRAIYLLLEDIYDRFLALSKDQRVDALRSKASKEVKKTFEPIFLSIIPVAYQKWLTSDMDKPSDLTLQMTKGEYYPFKGTIISFIRNEVKKNMEESGQTIAKTDITLLTKLTDQYVTSQLPNPI